MKQEIVELIINVANDMNETLEQKIPTDKGAETPLYGNEAVLDSLGLVRFILQVEEAIEDEFETTIVLADEKAMSQKNSPFRNVETLAAYIEKILKENRSYAA
ncbi:MAG: acyl carrier protein [Candidatus Marinimicrobia bacterium]|nr:acyl carrier protein [Candidatus Neomarinimicrobiota bacterium]